MTGREELEAAIGPSLARALDASAFVGPSFSSGAAGSTDALASADLLFLFVDAAQLSPDTRLRQAAAVVADGVRSDWPLAPGAATISIAMRSIDACLRASDVCGEEVDTHALIADAVDELERIVGPLYRPGEGIAHTVGSPGDRGGLADQVGTASALLTAHALTGRLPYSMLAEELMRFARRTCWPAAAETSSPELFVAACEVVRVECRLAALHQDEDYRASAVIGEEVDYPGEAEEILRSLSGGHRLHDVAVASEFGLALSDWLSFRHG